MSFVKWLPFCLNLNVLSLNKFNLMNDLSKNTLINQATRKQSMKLIKLSECHKETSQVSSQSHEQFVQKWSETARPIRGQEKVGIQWCMTKS